MNLPPPESFPSASASFKNMDKDVSLLVIQFNANLFYYRLRINDDYQHENFGNSAIFLDFGVTPSASSASDAVICFATRFAMSECLVNDKKVTPDIKENLNEIARK